MVTAFQMHVQLRSTFFKRWMKACRSCRRRLRGWMSKQLKKKKGKKQSGVRLWYRGWLKRFSAERLHQGFLRCLRPCQLTRVGARSRGAPLAKPSKQITHAHIRAWSQMIAFFSVPFPNCQDELKEFCRAILPMRAGVCSILFASRIFWRTQPCRNNLFF